MPVFVRGLHELQASLKYADRSLRLGVRSGLRQVAEPVQRGAEELAMSEIKRMPRSPKWSKMRVGITRDLVYIAPRQKGTRGRGDPRWRRGQGFAHPPFSDILMDRAMEPALERHAGEIEARFEELLDRVSDDFNHGGAL
jgi:hypothetical protein